MGNCVQFVAIDHAIVSILNQQTAIDAFKVARWNRCRPVACLQQTDVFFLSNNRLGAIGHGRCNDDLNKLSFDNGARRIGIEFSIKGNDAAKRGFAVSVKREVVGTCQRTCHGNPTGVSVFYNDTGGLTEALDAFQRGVGIGHIIIRQCFAL